MRRLVPFALSAALAALAAVLWTENRALREQLATARLDTARTAAPAPPPDERGDPGEPAPEPGRPRRPRGGAELLGAVGRMMASPPPPDADGPPPDPQARRERQQKRVRDLLSRLAGESDEQYRARVAPLVGLALARPRQRVEDQRREFEAAAELSEAQRGDLDRALGDARAELVGLASKAVTAGDLTPYRRNSLGLLSFAGDAAGVAQGFDARLRQILGPEQLGLLDQTGFDIVEYLGLTTPWESVTPPPPAPNL